MQDFMAANHKKHLQQEREQRQQLAAAAAQRQRIKELAAQQREVSRQSIIGDGEAQLHVATQVVEIREPQVVWRCCWLCIRQRHHSLACRHYMLCT
jgi:hypothetical protein